MLDTIARTVSPAEVAIGSTAPFTTRLYMIYFSWFTVQYGKSAEITKPVRIAKRSGIGSSECTAVSTLEIMRSAAESGGFASPVISSVTSTTPTLQTSPTRTLTKVRERQLLVAVRTLLCIHAPSITSRRQVN